MTRSKPTLIIIPGLGDQTRRYRPLAFLWKRLGYDVQIFSFEWCDSREDFQAALKRLLKHLETFKGKVNIIGVSAGGSAAVNAIYLRPDKVNKVITVAAAFQYVSSLNNKKMKDSIENLKTVQNQGTHDRILSFLGVYDQKIPLSSTKHLQAEQRTTPVIGHGLIIFTTLTFRVLQIRKFLDN